jgi:hypothetical protein
MKLSAEDDEDYRFTNIIEDCFGHVDNVFIEKNVLEDKEDGTSSSIEVKVSRKTKKRNDVPLRRSERIAQINKKKKGPLRRSARIAALKGRS